MRKNVKKCKEMKMDFYFWLRNVGVGYVISKSREQIIGTNIENDINLAVKWIKLLWVNCSKKQKSSLRFLFCFAVM